MRKNCIYLAFCLLAVSCSSIDYSVYNKTSYTNKTITVPIGNNRVLNTIKKYLAKNNWEVFISSVEGAKTTGTIDKSIDVNTSTVYKTKYLMVFMHDYNNDFGYYDITIIDLFEKKEILNFSANILGPSTAGFNDIERKFDEAMKASKQF